MLNHSKGVRDIVLDLKFTLDGKNIIISTNKELYIAEFQKNKLNIRKTTGWGNDK